MNDKEKLHVIKAKIEELRSKSHKRAEISAKENFDTSQTVNEVLERAYAYLSHFIDSLNDDKCQGCNNVKGCITCENGDQWAHIEEAETSSFNEEFNRIWDSDLSGKIDTEAALKIAQHFAEWGKKNFETPTNKHVFKLQGEICASPEFFCKETEKYLDYDNNEMQTIMEGICDIVNENYPDDENRFNVTIQLTIDKENENTNQ